MTTLKNLATFIWFRLVLGAEQGPLSPNLSFKIAFDWNFYRVSDKLSGKLGWNSCASNNIRFLLSELYNFCIKSW